MWGTVFSKHYTYLQDIDSITEPTSAIMSQIFSSRPSRLRRMEQEMGMELGHRAIWSTSSREHMSTLLYTYRQRM